MATTLKGQTAVVTGGAGQSAGLGRGLVKRFAAAGMKVAVVDIDKSAAIRLVDELKSEGREGLAIEADVMSPDSLQAAASQVDAAFGSCHVLCAHVGGGGQGRFIDLPIETWQQTMQLMVTGTVATIQAFLPLIQRTDGLRRIVLTSSVAALAPGRYQGPYRAAKAAVMSIGETLALELEAEGIGTTIAIPSGMLPPELIDLGREVVASGPQPADIQDPINIEMAIAGEMIKDPTDLALGEDAAQPVVEAVLVGLRYVITHGKTAEACYQERHNLIQAAFAELASRSYRTAPE
jgi:NAD(P)-dependent dehydrogenase (short-subunit alcohol dehydrogenase family)